VAFRRFRPKKKKKIDEDAFGGKLRLPREKDGEMFALATQRMGGDQIKCMAADGEERSCRIPGKLRKKVWVREGDVVIIRLWDFQPSKADIVWRYLGFQTERLKREGRLKDLPV
jgi:translation initiation factor 1A